MAFYIDVNLPGSNEGDEVEVVFLGTFANGATHEVTEAAVRNWELQSGQTWPEDGNLLMPQPRADEPSQRADGLRIDPKNAPVTEITPQGTIVVDTEWASVVNPDTVARVEGEKVPMDVRDERMAGIKDGSFVVPAPEDNPQPIADNSVVEQPLGIATETVTGTPTGETPTAPVTVEVKTEGSDN